MLTAGLILVSTVVVAACDSGGSSTTPQTRRNTPTSTVQKVEGVSVNLMLTGDRTATIVGTRGSCTIPRFAPPTYVFNGSDYPTLGPSGSLRVVGPVVVNGTVGVPSAVKVNIDEVGFLSANGSGITLSPNHQMVKIDTDLTGGLGGAEDINLNSPDNSLHGHITGTIRCT
jgi:hypothetical protein